MFKDTQAFSSFSVRDLAAAKEFYGAVLGVEVQETPEGLELHLAGGLQVFLYPSESNAPAEFTVLNFLVADVERAVDALIAKGVTMEQYDMPELKTNAKGIVERECGEGMGPKAMAWFRDPSGNIVSVLQEK